MHRYITALVSRRALVVVIGTLMPVVEVHAQLRMAWDATAAASQVDRLNGRATSAVPVSDGGVNQSKWLGLSALGTTLQFDRSYGQLRGDGLVRAGEIRPQASGALNALVVTPSWNGFQLSGSFDGKRNSYSEGLGTVAHDDTSLRLRVPTKVVPNWQATTSSRISYVRNSNGWWIGAATRRGAAVGDSVSAFTLQAGYSRQIHNVIVGLYLGSQSSRSGGRLANFRDSTFYLFHVDSITRRRDSVLTTKTLGDSGVAPLLKRWSEIGGKFGWSHGHYALDATVNARPRIGNLPSAVWGDASGTAALTGRIALVAALRTTSVAPGLALAASRTVSVGMRIAPPALWRPASPSPTRSRASTFSVRQSAPGEYVIALQVPSARSIELAGDFTGWKAVAFRQIDNSRWEVTVHANAGAHRCNIRIDGAEWVPPPHVTAIDDEFNGRVGLIVVE